MKTTISSQIDEKLPTTLPMLLSVPLIAVAMEPLSVMML